MFRILSQTLINFFHKIGSLYLFLWEVRCTWFLNLKSTAPLVIEQIGIVGFRSLSTILFSGFFVGAILVIQYQVVLVKYDASSLLGGLNTSSTLREIGPLIISFLLAGKVGAYTAAELGTMRVTEQIDAIRCLGTDPIEYIVVPRFIAIVICALLLLVFGLLIGILGGMTVANVLYHINWLQFLQSAPQFTDRWTIIGSVFKSFVYGTIVAAVCTYEGYHTTGGAKGVGKAVTQSAVYTNLLIVLANTWTSILLDSFQDFIHWFHGGIG